MPTEHRPSATARRLTLAALIGAVLLTGCGAADATDTVAVKAAERPTAAKASSTPTLPAGSIGFGEPRVLSRAAPDHEIDDPIVAVSPTGTTAVMWRDASGFERGQRFRADYLVSIGRDAAHLQAPTPIRAARTAAKLTGETQLLARPDGGFVACFDESGRRRGTATFGCSFAVPGGAFGPLRVVLREPWTKRSTVQPVVRADGTVLVLVTRTVGRARRSVSVVTLAPSGRRTTQQDLGEIRGAASASIATTTDGTVAVAWSDGPAQDYEPAGTPVLRVLSPTGTRFMPAAFPENKKISGGVGLVGGAALLVEYSTDPLMDGAQQRIARRLPDGTFAPPGTLPRPGKGFVSGSALALGDGTPLAVTSSDVQSETDCGNSTGGSVGAGPLMDLTSATADDDSAADGPVTTTRLSDPKQIAQYPTTALLGDGTVIVAWGDAFDGGAQSRLEVTTRRSGAATFSTPQVLPRPARSAPALAAAGDQALLAWSTGPRGGRQAIIVSALRSAAPFAKQQRRPTDPGTSCS